MNFDITLCYVAADIIAAGINHRPIRPANRRGFFQLYEGDEGLHEGQRWHPGAQQVHLYGGRFEGVDELGEDECACPPWMACYCERRDKE